MANQDIRRAAGAAGVRLWQIAGELGITDSYLSRKMRVELTADEKKKVLQIIQTLSAEVL